MGNQQYALHSHITFVPSIKLGWSQAYPLNLHGNIYVADLQYQNNIHNYYLVKNMNRALKKIFVAAINGQWIKGAKDMVMEYASKN